MAWWIWTIICLVCFLVGHFVGWMMAYQDFYFGDDG